MAKTPWTVMTVAGLVWWTRIISIIMTKQQQFQTPHFYGVMIASIALPSICTNQRRQESSRKQSEQHQCSEQQLAKMFSRNSTKSWMPAEGHSFQTWWPYRAGLQCLMEFVALESNQAQTTGDTQCLNVKILLSYNRAGQYTTFKSWTLLIPIFLACGCRARFRRQMSSRIT